MILNKILEQSSKKYANKPALNMKMGFRNVTLTYKEVYEISKKIAVFLEKQGISHGDKVLICAINSPYWICVFWGTLLRGAIIVPLNIQSTGQIINRIAKQSEAKLIFKHVFFKHEMPSEVKQFDIEYINDLIHGIDANQFNEVKINEDDLFQIMYTSGTTGDPKGVMLTHKNVYSNIHSLLNIIIVNFEKDHLLSVLPLSHIFEQTAGFLLPFSQGVNITYVHSYAAIRQLIKKYQITKMIVVPEFLHILFSRIESEAHAKGKKKLFDKLLNISQKFHNKFLSRILFHPVLKKLGGKINTFASGGAPLDPELEQDWNNLGIDVLQGYGLTETSPVVTTNTYQAKKIGSVGKVIPGVEVKMESDGEILVKGPNVFKGYYKDEQKTKDTFTADGWFKTGDLGEFDKDGFLFIKGRKKYLIKGPGGQNIYSEDIEAELNKISGVIDSCVLGIEKPSGIEIHAVLILDSKNSDDPQKIIDLANSELASYQHITAWTIWPDVDFPRTVTRKIKKEDVRKFLEGKQKDIHKVGGRENHTLIQILSQITGVAAEHITESTKIVPDLNFDSLMRVEFISWLEEDLGITIDESDIKPTTTVKDLQKIIDEKKPVQELSQLKNWPRSKWILPIRFITQQLFFLMLKPFVKLKVEGLHNLENVPYPVIFMPNHMSFLDSAVVAEAIPWRIRKKLSFAAASDFLYEYYKKSSVIVDAIFNSFPIQRGENENIKLGLDFIGQMLDKGFSVVLFPEGQMSATGKLLPLRRGAGLVATEMNVWIVPVKIIGTQDIVAYAKILPHARGEVIVRFGKPMKFNRSDAHSVVAEKIHDTIRDL